MPDYKLYQEGEWEFVEVDPSGRYGRYNEVLGKGASKTVYRAFDERDGIEVAWNQVKIKDVLQAPEDLERLYSEVHLLKTLNHKNIIKFYSSWVDTKSMNINFVTEMFTSGSLRQFRQKHKRVDIRAVKNWSRQILRGLLYLHSHDPPIIHRDLKCDNIFINGNQGEVKIGDLGLAAILRKSHSAHSIIGTPEFMAPELYDEEYNELVDIYAFGMCLLEMLTFEYPYSECSNPAQIYKKVTSGKKPACLYKVKDPEVRQFVEKCLATVSRRLPARELLMDPFLHEHGIQHSFSNLDVHRDDMDELGSFLREIHINASQNGDNVTHKNLHFARPAKENGIVGHHETTKHNKVVPLPASFIEDDLSHDMDFTVKGKKRDDDTIFLRLRIADKEGRIRNIYFPFDVQGDTAMSVASEMVAELDLADQDVTKIADMIDEEILALVPNWKAGVAIDDYQPCMDHCHCVTKTTEDCCGSYTDCFSTISSDSSMLEYLRSHYLVDNMPGMLPCCTQVECAAMHGRFEEVTFQVDGTGFSSYATEEIPTISSESSDVLRHDSHYWAAEVAGSSRSTEPSEKTTYAEDLDKAWRHGLSEGSTPVTECSCLNSPHKQQSPSTVDPLSDEDIDSINKELRFLAIEHEQELKELQRKHENAILEVKNRWKNRKALRSYPNRNKISGGVNSQECKMKMNGGQEQWEEDYAIQHTTASDKEFGPAKQHEPDNGGTRYSRRSNPKVSKNTAVICSDITVSRETTLYSYPALMRSPLHMHSSPPKPAKRNLAPNRRLMKMHSFSEVDSQLHMNSRSTEIGKLKGNKPITACRVEKHGNTKHCHGGSKQMPSIPRSSSRDYREGRSRQ
ncbi:hypothetical protein SUGI_0445640 [Cryptomeria japonica]|nr:hypothetical protein SUGI_0445640 [Cryptomeria japonica]